MMILQLIFASALAIMLFWPDLPISKTISGTLLRGCAAIGRHATVARALTGIGVALFLFAMIWALQGDAPMFLAMILPELAAWFATFEIATLLEAAVAVGASIAGARAVGVGTFLRSKITRNRAPRPRRQDPANDDEDSPELVLRAA